LLLGRNSSHTFLGRRFFWEIPKLITSLKIDIVIGEISRITIDYFQKYPGYILPEFAFMRINIDRPLSELTKRSVSDYSSWKEYLWFGVNEYSSVAQDFIRNNPFIYLDKDNKVVRYII